VEADEHKPAEGGFKWTKRLEKSRKHVRQQPFPPEDPVMTF